MLLCRRRLCCPAYFRRPCTRTVYGAAADPLILLFGQALFSWQAQKEDTDIVKATTDSYAGMSRSFPKEAFESTVMMDFEDTRIPVPAGFDAILKICYGDYMQLPPAEKRVPHRGGWSKEDRLLTPEDFVFDGAEN